MKMNNILIHFLAFLLFVFLPLGVFAPKSPVLLLVLAAVAAVPVACGMLRRHRPSLPGPPLRALGLLLGWALVSAVWALDGGDALTLTLRVLALAVAAVVLHVAVQNMTAVQLHRLAGVLAGGFGVALGVLAVEYFFGGPLLSVLVAEGVVDHFNFSRYNPGSTLLTIAIWPLALFLLRRRGAVAAAAVVLGGAVVLVQSDAFAATLALAVGILAVAVAAAGRRAIRVVAVVVPCLILAGPFVIEAVGPPGAPGGLVPADLADPVAIRLHIWSFAADRILEAPLLGWGMDASRDIPGGNALIPGFGGQEYIPLHTHNGTLQVWLELGAVGAAGVAAFLGLILYRIAGIETWDARAASLATMGSILAIANLSYGVWQNWWLAALGLLWVSLGIARRSQPDERKIQD